MSDESAVGGDAGRRVVVKDALIVLIGTFVVLFISVRFDIYEAIFIWTRRFEVQQFDELPIVLIAFATGFVWFAIRRVREREAAVRHQQLIESRLNEVLIENRRLARQNVAAQEAERRNITRELHDEMGQYLNAIKIDAVSLRDGAGDKVDPREMGSHIARNADHVYSVVISLIRQLRSIAFDELGLIAALEQCVEQWRPRLPQTRIEF